MEGFQSAIIGCGSIFGAHAEAMRQLDEACLAAVVDIHEVKATEAAERYNCRSYTDYCQMLRDKRIQVVHMAASLEECDAILKAAEIGAREGQNAGKLSVIAQNRLALRPSTAAQKLIVLA